VRPRQGRALSLTFGRVRGDEITVPDATGPLLTYEKQYLTIGDTNLYFGINVLIGRLMATHGAAQATE
jgi:hypothetical protein